MDFELDLDDHLVTHDLVIIGTAYLLAALAGVLSGLSAWSAFAVGSLLAVTGVVLMEIGPARRSINRAILAVHRRSRR